MHSWSHFADLRAAENMMITAATEQMHEAQRRCPLKHGEAYSSPAGFAGKPSTDCDSVHMVTFLSHSRAVNSL